MTVVEVERYEHASLFEALSDDPYPLYRHCLATGRPLWIPPEPDKVSDGVWLFSRHADASTIFRLQTEISKELRAARPEGMASPFDLFMFNRDGEDHLRLRRLVSSFLTAERLARLEQELEGYAEELVAGLALKDEVELMAGFAEPLPLRVVASLMGLPLADMAKVRAWTLAFSPALDTLQAAAPQVRDTQQRVMQEFLSYGAGVLGARSALVEDGLIGHLIAAEESGGMSQEELLVAVVAMLFASHETTVNMIGNGIDLLLRDREQLHLLNASPSLLDSAVEEVLRFESPAQRATYRIAREPLQIGEHWVAPGEQIYVLIGAANRDPLVFVDPDRFDITRKFNPHLAFGAGLYNCVGKALARMEGRIALRAIAPLLQQLETVDPTPRWRCSSILRGLEVLPARRHQREYRISRFE